MARVVVAGAGAIGASIAYHLALRGADDVVLAEVGEIAGGATGKAMGGVRQQFTTEAEVRLAQASVRLFRELGPPLFEQVGYLFLATTEVGLAELEERRRVQASFGVPVERVDPAYVDGLRVDDVLGASICREDGIADPAGVTRELVRRAAGLGVEVRERTDALSLEAETLVVACGADSARRRRGARCRAAGPPARAPARGRRAGGGAARRPADDDRGERLPLSPRRRRRAASGDAGAGAALGRPGAGARGPRRGLARPARHALPARARALPSGAPGRASTT